MSHWTSFIHENAYLFTLLAVLAFSYVLVEIRTRSHGVEALSPAQLTHQANRDKAKILDIRPEAEFKKGHIVNAISMEPTEIDIEKPPLKKLIKNKLIIVCDSGYKAKPYAAKLKALGCDVAVLSGGIASWKQDKLPLTQN